MSKMSKATFRPARKSDLKEIIALLADDKLGEARESAQGAEDRYAQAFAEIDADPNNMVYVAEDGGKVVGTIQVTFIANLTFTGARRALVEAVRIADSHQGQGLGGLMMEYVIECARERGCKIVQLTSNKQRPDAIRFYEQQGFLPSHVGFKKYL